MASHGDIAQRDGPHVQIVDVLDVSAAFLLDIGSQLLDVDAFWGALHHHLDHF